MMLKISDETNLTFIERMKIEYLYTILESMRYDYSSKWKMFLEKNIAIWVCNDLLENYFYVEDYNNWYFRILLKEIEEYRIFNSNYDGRYFQPIIDKLFLTYFMEEKNETNRKTKRKETKIRKKKKECTQNKRKEKSKKIKFA